MVRVLHRSSETFRPSPSPFSAPAFTALSTAPLYHSGTSPSVLPARRSHLAAAYTCTDEEAQEWKGELEARFPGYEIHMDRLSLSVACHIGAGSMAVGCSRVVRR